MICPKCGEMLPDGSRFCGNCGAHLTEERSDEREVSSNSVALEAGKDAVIQPNFVQPKQKKKGIKKIAIIGIVAAVAIIAIAIISGIFSSGAGSNAYVYLSKGKYELITNLKKDTTIEIASSKTSETTQQLVRFSKDGKYVYYYTKVDSDNWTGTLCRAEVDKLKENSSKNDKYIEVIASNVQLGFKFLSDNGIVYKNSDNTLYYFDGKETQQVSKSVNNYYTNDNGQLIYEAGDSTDGFTLYASASNNIGDKIKLAANYSELVDTSDFGNILYTKSDENQTGLYVIGINRDMEKIASDIKICYRGSGIIYYTEKNGTKLNLYDYVSDNYATQDAGIKQPTRDDFSIPTYRYKMITGSNLKESNYKELYTSCTKDLYWYGESTWWSYSMQEAISRQWGDKTEAVHASTQSFINKFSSKANEDGYILVTDEVKAALKEINSIENNDWEWLWLCYTREQSGSTYDYDKYSEAMARYSEAAGRISTRDELKNKENDFAVNTLFKFEKGVITTIGENVLSTQLSGNTLIFNTLDMIGEKPQIESVSSPYDVISLFGIDYEAQNYFIRIKDGVVFQMSESAADAYSEVQNNGYGVLYVVGNSLFLNSYGDELYVTDITGGKTGTFTIITDTASVLRVDVDTNTLYYASDMYENNDNTYCDIYSYSNGQANKLAQDVMLANINLYEDGALLAYTGYRMNAGYELTFFEKDGAKTIIGDDITQFIRVDKSTLLYISDNDLFLYNGKEKKMIRTDVDWIWCYKKMDITVRIN